MAWYILLAIERPWEAFFECMFDGAAGEGVGAFKGMDLNVLNAFAGGSLISAVGVSRING